MASAYLNLKVIQVTDLDNPVEITTWLNSLTSANIIYSMVVQSNVFYFVYH